MTVAFEKRSCNVTHDIKLGLMTVSWHHISSPLIPLITQNNAVKLMVMIARRSFMSMVHFTVAWQEESSLLSPIYVHLSCAVREILQDETDGIAALTVNMAFRVTQRIVNPKIRKVLTLKSVNFLHGRVCVLCMILTTKLNNKNLSKNYLSLYRYTHPGSLEYRWGLIQLKCCTLEKNNSCTCEWKLCFGSSYTHESLLSPS
jgi:hypothetical protein